MGLFDSPEETARKERIKKMKAKIATERKSKGILII